MISSKAMVQKMKELRKEKRLSYQDIVDRTVQNGEPVSITTVKRVFSDNLNGTDFRLDNTLQPIARALGITFEPDDEPETEPVEDELDDEPITEQIKKVEDEEMQAALAMLRDTYEARVADLWSAIKMLRRDKVILIVIALALLLFVFYLFADGLHGDWGFFQYVAAQP